MKPTTKWNRKYWDLAEQFYWAPQYVGMRSIPQRMWKVEGDLVSVPRDLVNKSGPLYARSRTAKAHAAWLRTQEEILNHVFDITFAIAPAAVLDHCFLRPIGLCDNGHFESLGREIRSRYGWGESENVTQQDGLFVSQNTVLGVELKLGAKSNAVQILKYACLFAWEELLSGQRANLALVFVLEKANADRHWRTCGLGGPEVDRRLLDQLSPSELPRRLQQLLESSSETVQSVLDRMTIGAITWDELVVSIENLKHPLDPSNNGDRTLINLLEGFTDQVLQQTSSLSSGASSDG